MVLVAFDFDGTLSRDDLVQLLGDEYDVAGTSIGFLPNEDVEQRCDTVVTGIRKVHLYFEQHGIVDSTDGKNW